MAIRNSTSTPEYLQRAGSFNPVLNFTWAWWSRTGSVGTLRNYGDSTFNNPYIDVYCPPTAQVVLEVWDGTTVFDIGPFPNTVSVWGYFVLTYNAATTTLSLWRGTESAAVVLLGTLVVDLASITAVETDEILIGDAVIAGATDVAVGYDRVWQALLTEAEMNVEKGRTEAARTANLVSDTPLTSPTDLLDDSGNGNDWTLVGTMTTIAGPTSVTSIANPVGTMTTYLAGEVNKPLNDPSVPGTYGARKRPDISDFGVTHRAMSDPITGEMPVQTHVMKMNDARHFWRDKRELHDGDFTNSEQWAYLTSSGYRLSGGRPRLIVRGFIDKSPLPANLSINLSAVDRLGSAYKLHSPEPTLPQRTIRGANTSAGTPIFLNFLDPDVRDPRRVSFTIGPYRDTDVIFPPTYVVGGVLPAQCVFEFVMADGSTWVLGIISGHDHKDGIEQLYQPVDDTDPGLIPDNDPDVKWPGQTTAGWATINPSGAELFTIIDGERFTLFAVKGARAEAFKDGSRPIYANVKAPTDTANGRGNELTGFNIERWVWYNWIMRTPGYMNGPYFTTPPTFDFYPGGDQVCEFDDASFDVVQLISEQYLTGGFTFGGLVGLNGSGMHVREVIANLNRSGMTFTTYDQLWRLKKVMLDRDRTRFLAGKRGLDPYRKTGIVADPNFSEEERVSWLMNNLRVQYAHHGRLNNYLGDLQDGRSESFLKYGSVYKDITLPYVITTEQAEAIMQQLLDVYSRLPKVSQWARPWCGLEDDLGDGRAVTHFNGNGGEGYTAAGHIYLEQDYVYAKGQVVNRALFVEHVLAVAAESEPESPAAPAVLESLEISGDSPGDGYESQFTALLNYTNGSSRYATTDVTWVSDNPAVASVTVDGVVTGEAVGSTTIRAQITEGSVTVFASQAVTVTTITLTSVVVSGTAPLIGESRQLTLTANWSSGPSTNVTKLAAWVSLDTSKFTVGAATGVATGVAAGSADVEATFGGMTDALTLVIAAPGTGVFYYVSTTGSDTAGAGSFNAPWRTLSFAVAQLAVNDTLYIRSGTYTGTENVIDNSLSTVPTGTSWGNPITVAGYPDELPILAPPGSNGSIGLQGNLGTAEFLIFQDLIFDGVNTNTASDSLVYISGGSNHIRFQRIELRNAQLFGFHISSNNGLPTHIEILNSVLHNNGLNLTPSCVCQQHAIYVTSGSDCLIEGNELYSNYGTPVNFYNDHGPLNVSNNIVRKNLIHDNHSSMYSYSDGYRELGGSTAGILFAWGTNNLIYDNLIFRNDLGIQIYTNSSANEIYNNTIWANDTYGVVYQYYLSGSTTTNNIVYANGVQAFKDYGGTGTQTFSNNLETNPNFVNQTAFDFHLQPGSAAIGTGATLADVPDDYYGTARSAPYDIGAVAA